MAISMYIGVLHSSQASTSKGRFDALAAKIVCCECLRNCGLYSKLCASIFTKLKMRKHKIKVVEYNAVGWLRMVEVPDDNKASMDFGTEWRNLMLLK